MSVWLRSLATVCLVSAGALWLLELLKPLAVATQVQMHLVLLVGLLGLAGLATTSAGPRQHLGRAALLCGWTSVGLGAWVYLNLSSAVPYALALAALATVASWAALVAMVAWRNED